MKTQYRIINIGKGVLNITPANLHKVTADNAPAPELDIDHNNLENIQGGDETGHYHLNFEANEYLTEIVANDTIRLILEAIAVPPIYIQPVASVTNVSQSAEEGITLSINITQTFTKNDAGDKTSEVIRRNGADVSITNVFTEALIVPLGNTNYNGVITYSEGEVKNNNLSIPDPAGKVLAGSVISGTRTVTGLQKRYYGSVAILPSSTYDGAANRIYAENLNKALKTVGVNSFTLVTGTVNNKFIVLLPINTTITSVIDTTNLNLNLTADYVLSTITIKNADGVDRAYNNYTFSPAGRYPVSANHVITTN